MFLKRILIALMILCMTATSCIGICPQVFADTAEGTQDEILQNQDDPENGDDQQEGEGTIPEPEPEPEPEIPVINAWDEDGYYHGSDGEIVTNLTLKIGGKVYIFDETGAASLYEGTFTDADGKQYYYKNGVKHTGAALIGNKPYYYKNGIKQTGVKYLYNKKCYKDGKVYTGVYKSYYYNKGVKVTKYKNKVAKVSNGKFYYFKKNASVSTKTGWIRLNGKRYYLKKGVAYTGWKYIGNYKYYFHKNSASLCQDLIACQGSKWKKKDLLIKVNRKKNIVTIYAKDGKNGYTIPVKALVCSVGKKKTPTIKGTYTMKAGTGRTYRWHLLGGPSLGVDYSYGQYCVRIYKSWLFHSVTYKKQNNMTLITEEYNKLGTAASRGCIRLQVKDAKLIYDIVKYRNTKVKIFDSDWVGPFDKPTVKKLPAGQKYDPSDSTVKK